MKHGTMLTATTTIALTVTLTGCTSNDSDLAAQVLDAIPTTSATQVTLELAEIRPGGWDSYLVVCPYETLESVNERLGFTWDDGPDLTLDDAHQILVLTDADAIEEYATLDRNRIDLCTTEQWSLTEKATPITLIEQDGVWTGSPRNDR
ncbi:hypothetical protein [Microbacterium saperdae]|nr:hypothetical protein [Microbacterium saperdae]GGM35285.1 hypothetical protein GCM10010489_02680 [Microbacterium saperdae]